MIIYKKVLIFLMPILLVGTVYTQVIDKPVDVEKLTQEFMENEVYFNKEQKRCNNLPSTKKENDYTCVAVSKALKLYMMKNYTDIGNPIPIKKLP
jgi:hypothetical protein